MSSTSSERFESLSLKNKESETKLLLSHINPFLQFV